MCPTASRSSKLGFVTITVTIAFFIAILTVVISHTLKKADISARRSTCASNMRCLAVAIQAYCTDYYGVLPSSAIISHSKTWNSADFIRFGSGGTAGPNWQTALTKYAGSYQIGRCPSDEHPKGTSSYFWKAAVDRAWYGGIKKYDDYKWQSRYVFLYEHNGWHRNQISDGLADGVVINVAYMDGHMARTRIRNSGYVRGEAPSPLPKSGKGEPAWFNSNIKTGKCSTDQLWDANVYVDDLQKLSK